MDSVDGGRHSLDILLTSLVVQIFNPPFLIGRRARKMIVSKKEPTEVYPHARKGKES